jgi:hypothetical protein
MLALYYSMNDKFFLHEIPILYDDLEWSSEEIYDILSDVHEAYLYNISPN